MVIVVQVSWLISQVVKGGKCPDLWGVPISDTKSKMTISVYTHAHQNMFANDSRKFLHVCVLSRMTNGAFFQFPCSHSHRGIEGNCISSRNSAWLHYVATITAQIEKLSRSHSRAYIQNHWCTVTQARVRIQILQKGQWERSGVDGYRFRYWCLEKHGNRCRVRCMVIRKVKEKGALPVACPFEIHTVVLRTVDRLSVSGKSAWGDGH